MSNEHLIGDYIYLSVPSEWLYTYRKLLFLLSCAGKEMLDDCNYACKNNGKNVYNCWSIFQSALAAKALGEDKKANLFIDYIDKQLNIYAKNYDVEIPEFDDNEPICLYKLERPGVYSFIVKVTSDGREYVKTFEMPNFNFYYGCSAVNDAELIDLKDLTRSDNYVNKTLNITVEEGKPYIWFVTEYRVKFEAAGFEVLLEETYLNNLYYYRTDALQTGTDNIFTILRYE